MKEPKIRFNGFEGEWEETTIGNTASLRAGKSFNFQRTFEHMYPCYGGNGIRNYIDEYSHEGTYPIIGRQGALCGNVTLAKGKFYATEHAVVASPLKCNDSLFLYYCYTKANLNQYAKGCAQPGLAVSAINEVVIRIPDYQEQQSIASFFTTIDAQISASTSRLASLKQIKAASLQAMFPQEGETVPKLRFKGFEGEWEKVKLGEIFSERLERSDVGEMLSVTLNNGIIKAAENGRFDNSSEDKSNYKVVKVGDIAYNTMRMWQGASGNSQYNGIVSPAYTVVVPNDEVESSFFAYYFKTHRIIKLFRLHSQGLTKDTWNLKYPAFKVIELLFPNNIAEQRAIASYFTNLDRQITLQSQRLEKLKQIKAACLDKMFV